MNLVTVLVNTSDGYEDCWEPFFTLFEKNWPNCKYELLLNTELKIYKFKDLNIECIQTQKEIKKRLTWSEGLKVALENVKTPFVLYFQEDLKINYTKEQIYRLVFAFSKEEQEAIDFILENYFTQSENKPMGFYWVSSKLNQLGDKILKRLNSSRENGKKGGRGKKKEIKPMGSNPLNPKHNLDESILNETKLKEINPIYKKLSNDLLFILEAKLQRKLSSKNWEDEIKKLIEKDLSVRQNPIEDVKQAIQTISNNYGKEYFPVIQSAKSLKEKFTKIEDYVKRSSQGKNNQSAENDRPKFLSQYQHLLNK
jgi:uncharacterized protein YdaU (DUF1376 family)